jgi:hypothetical protein
MRLAPATIAPSHSRLSKAAQAICKQYNEDEQAVSITKLEKGIRVSIHFRRELLRMVYYLGPKRLNTWLTRFPRIVVPIPVAL